MLSVAARCEGGTFDDVVEQVEEFGSRSGRHIRFVCSFVLASKSTLMLILPVRLSAMQTILYAGSGSGSIAGNRSPHKILNCKHPHFDPPSMCPSLIELLTVTGLPSGH